MACPNCGNDMQARRTLSQVYWCPRCGSIRDGQRDQPALVGRLEAFVGTLRIGDTEDARIIDAMQRLGIFECLPNGSNKQ